MLGNAHPQHTQNAEPRKTARNAKINVQFGLAKKSTVSLLNLGRPFARAGDSKYVTFVS